MNQRICKPIREYGEYPCFDKEGKCLGFSHINDDEPIYECKNCKKCSLYGIE